MFSDKSAYVVEDDAHSLIAIGSALRDLHISYKRNTTGAEVVPRLFLMESLPDFILLDLELPEGDAFSIITQIKTDERLKSIPVIALSDTLAESRLENARNAGFDGLIAKPIPRQSFGSLLVRMFAGEQLWSNTIPTP